MSTRKRTKREKFLRDIRCEGWLHVGWAGSGHLVVEHTTGATTTIACTPSGWHTENHERRKLQKLAGCTQRAG